MKRYRSDWPELGWTGAVRSGGRGSANGARRAPPSAPVLAATFPGAEIRLVALPSPFETRLYGFPIWSLHLEVDAPDDVHPADLLEHAGLRVQVSAETRRLLEAPPWGSDAYVSSRLVEGEPLHRALCDEHFDVVERRRLYLCRIGDLDPSPDPAESRFACRTLASVPAARRDACHGQMRQICREAFDVGHSRHFTDPFLLERMAGLEYILALMDVNFGKVSPERLLVAAAGDSDQLCGFSVLGVKPGLAQETYTQLLSAVRKECSGQGIYRGLTALLARTMPPQAMLLNVTHPDNLAIQKAYADSGRRHLADTVIVRRRDKGGAR